MTARLYTLGACLAAHNVHALAAQYRANGAGAALEGGATWTVEQWWTENDVAEVLLPLPDYLGDCGGFEGVSTGVERFAWMCWREGWYEAVRGARRR